MSEPRAELAAGPWQRRILTVCILWLALVGAASLGKKTAPGAAVRELTAPFERALGIWQSWGMFGPTPPRGSSWLEVSGLEQGGSVVPLEALVGELSTQRTELLYDRVRKVERNMFDKGSTRLRQGYAEWLCAQALEAEAPLVYVRLVRANRPTPAPGERVPAEQIAVQRKTLDQVACP